MRLYRNFLPALFAVMMCLGGTVAVAQQNGGIPADAECSVPVCVAPDLTIIPTPPQPDCVPMFIGQTQNLCCDFLVTGGGGMNFDIDWTISSDNTGIATVENKTAHHGSTSSYGSEAGGETTFTGTFSGADVTQEGEYYIQLCGDVTSVSAGTARVTYTIELSNYTF